MKKLIGILFVFTMLVSLTGCESAPPIVPPTVNSVRTEEEDLAYSPHTIIHEYDALDREVKYTSLDAFGDVSHYVIIEYYGDTDSVKKEYLYRADHSIADVTEYDMSGNMLKSTMYTEKGAVMLYIIYEYDSSGNMVKSTEYDANGNVKHETTYKY